MFIVRLPEVDGSVSSSNAQNENSGMISIIVSSESQVKSSERACTCCAATREARSKRKVLLLEDRGMFPREMYTLLAGIHVASRKGTHSWGLCTRIVIWRRGFGNVVGLYLKEPLFSDRNESCKRSRDGRVERWSKAGPSTASVLRLLSYFQPYTTAVETGTDAAGSKPVVEKDFMRGQVTPRFDITEHINGLPIACR